MALEVYTSDRSSRLSQLKKEFDIVDKWCILMAYSKGTDLVCCRGEGRGALKCRSVNGNS